MADSNPDAVKQAHHGECPWCLAHPHREPCSPNCKAAREDALREIEARAKKYRQLAARAATPADEEVIRWLAKQTTALCAIVRALRIENETEHAAHMVTIENLQETLAKYDPLREQLAHTQQQLTETQKAVDHWVIMYNKVSSDNTRLVNQQEEPDVKRAAEIVSDAICNSGFTDNKPSTRSWVEGRESVVIAQLQSQLAQAILANNSLTASYQELEEEYSKRVTEVADLRAELAQHKVESLTLEGEPEKQKPVDVCVVCKSEPVCPEEGFDTCTYCARRI